MAGEMPERIYAWPDPKVFGSGQWDVISDGSAKEYRRADLAAPAIAERDEEIERLTTINAELVDAHNAQNLAGAHQDEAIRRKDARIAELEAALRQIERLYWEEGKSLSWRASHMRGVAENILDRER